MKFENSAVVVTGGASGIGKGLCERFAALGAEHIVVADMDIASAQAVADQIGGSAVECNVTDEASVQALAATALETMGRIDLFCANAGVGQGDGLDTTDELWELSWQVNVMGVVRCARAVIPAMTDNGGGNFMVTASAAGLTTGPVSFNYATSKHGTIGVAEWLAIHHPSIKVSALCPTVVDTPMMPMFGTTIVEPLSVDDVVDAAIAGLEDDRFMITPTDMTNDLFRAKANDWNGFYDGMRANLAKVDKVYGD